MADALYWVGEGWGVEVGGWVDRGGSGWVGVGCRGGWGVGGRRCSGGWLGGVGASCGQNVVRTWSKQDPTLSKIMIFWV